jgi:hypothetical protein
LALAGSYPSCSSAGISGSHSWQRRDAEHGERQAEAERDSLEQRLAVDRVGHGVAHVDVQQRRVAVADTAGHAVHRQFGEAALRARHRHDAVRAVQTAEQLGGMSFATSSSPLSRADTIAAPSEKKRNTIWSMAACPFQ